MTLADQPTIILGPPPFPPQLAARRRPLSKVPERITGHFWVIKVLTTAMGEAASDFLAHHMNPFLAGFVGALAFAIALGLQLSVRRYQPARYWFTVAMVAVFGTMAADGVHFELGVPYILSSLFYGLVLAGVLVAWYRSEGTLSIHSIVNRRRELYYWATVLATFALGTAVGDLTAFSFHIGFLASAVLFLVLFALPGLAWRYSALGPVAAFWTAYVLTRPLGASVADWLDMPRAYGGLNLGRGTIAVVLAVPIVALVWYLARTRLDVFARPPATSRSPRPAAPSPRAPATSRSPRPAAPSPRAPATSRSPRAPAVSTSPDTPAATRFDA